MNFSDYYEYYANEDTPAVPLPEAGEGGAVERNTDMPVIPLPNPGEGGPVAPDNNMNNIPSIPLPNPGEGGPVAPDNNMNNIPMIPLPNPGEGGPVYPGGGSNIPVIPLPNPGEGGPVNTGSIITVIPRPIVPCFFCNSSSFGNVRFLNAATGYNPFRIAVNSQTVVGDLEYAEISQYGRISSGYQTVTVSGQNGYIYISRQVQINAGAKMTIAIINTAGGLDLALISDVDCNTPLNLSCLRACNLSYNSGPLNLLLSNGYVVFRNMRFMDVTNFNRLLPGRYQFYVSRGSLVLISSEINVRSNSLYTVYIFNWNNSPDAIRTMIVEDRK